MASETTPLLPASNDAEDAFPPILTAVRRLSPDPNLIDFQDLYPHPLGRAQPLRAVAFRLLVVLHLLVNNNNEYTPSRTRSTIQAFQDYHEQDRRRGNLRRIALAILGYVPAAITDAGLPGPIEGVPKDVSVEHILFASFLIDPLSSQRLRVIDLLAHSAVPAAVLGDNVIGLCLIRLWKYGQASLEPLPSESLIHRVSRIYDAASTPRAIHAVHLAAHLIYVVLLAHLILYPSAPPILLRIPGGPIGLREPTIAIYSISNIAFHSLSFSVFPHVLVLFALFISLPASPSSDATTFSLLPLALCLHILFVQSPNYPTILLLYEPTRWLPVGSLFVVCLERYILPAFVFLLPTLLASAVLLSFSLSGPMSNRQPINLYSTTALPSTFLILFFVGCFLFLYLSVSALLLSSSTSHKDEDRWHWESYGASVGIAARRSLIRAILAYSPSRQPLYLAYPPPLNILSVPLKVLPWLPRKINRLFWRLVVGPFAIVVGGLWIWGFL